MFNKQYIFNQKKIFFIILSINLIPMRHCNPALSAFIGVAAAENIDNEKVCRDRYRNFCDKIIVDDNNKTLGDEITNDRTINFYYYKKPSKKILLAASIFLNNSWDKSLPSIPSKNHPIIFATDTPANDYIYLLQTSYSAKKRVYLNLDFINKKNTYIYGFLVPVFIGIIINILCLGILKLLFFLLKNKKYVFLYLIMFIINFIYMSLVKLIIKKFFSNKSFLLKNYFKNIDTNFAISCCKIFGLYLCVCVIIASQFKCFTQQRTGTFQNHIIIFFSIIFSLIIIFFIELLYILNWKSVGLYEKRSTTINDEVIDYYVIYLSNHHLQFLSKHLDKNGKLFKFDDRDINLTNVLNLFS